MSKRVSGRARLFILLTGICLAAVMNVGAFWIALQSRDWTETEARRELQNLALTLGEQTDQALQGLQLVQDSMMMQLGPSGLGSAAGFENSARRYDLHRAMEDRIKGLPQVDALTIVDASGQLLNFSRYWPIPDVNIADRDYFRVLAADPSLGHYVSAPVQNRGDGRVTVYIARAVRSPDGTFLGLILGALDLDYFRKLYRAVLLGPDSAITLLRRDGTFLARHPQPSRPVPEETIGRSRLFQEVLARSDHGTVRQISPVDGEDRFVSARALGRYPVVVTVSTLVDGVLSSWRQGVVSLVIGLSFLDVLIVTAVLLALRQTRNNDRLRHLARHDPLTGLPNRLSLREELESAARAGRPFSLALIDLDNFKAVNDVLGHPAGDDLLRKVAGLLRDLVGPDQMVARLGGDEFAMLDRSRDGSSLCERLLQALLWPIDLDGRRVTVSASIGVATAPRDATGPDELLRRAEMALYAAKAGGKAGWRRFEDAMERTLLEREAMAGGLRGAIGAGELELFLQPIVVPDTEAPIGFEALLRWRHPARGMVPPAEFIPIAETSGLIVPIGEWVMRRACTIAAAWSRPLTISINLSPVQFTSDDLVGSVRRALRDASLPPWRLEVEITESVLLQSDDKVLATLHALRALGVRIALDDFGTGYSSLSYLASFPFDRIKIDRSFVIGMLTDSTSATILRATITLAGNLGLTSTVEGVETVEQKQALLDAGASAFQGFLFGRPVPANEATTRYDLGSVAARPSPDPRDPEAVDVVPARKVAAGR